MNNYTENGKPEGGVARRTAVIIAGLLIATLLLGYMFTYQLRFNEVAVVTTFGSAERGVANREGEDAGLRFKLPWPIQKVMKFDGRARILESRLEAQETRDKHVVVLNTYCVWRIEEPLDFFRTFGTEEKAGRFIGDRLATARSVIGNFTFDELTNTDPSKLKLETAEKSMREFLVADMSGQSCGISIQAVGIKRIILPESITRAVFGRMRATRERLAQNAMSEGEAISRSIRAEAHSQRKRIMSFAERRANQIRSEGEAAGAQYYELFEKNEDFAIYLRKIETLKKMLGKNAMFILDTQTAPLDLIEKGLKPADVEKLLEDTSGADREKP